MFPRSGIDHTTRHFSFVETQTKANHNEGKFSSTFITPRLGSVSPRTDEVPPNLGIDQTVGTQSEATMVIIRVKKL